MNKNISEENRKFIEKFNPEKFDFFGLTPHEDIDIGFSVKKKLNKNDEGNVTLLEIYISDGMINKTENIKKSLSINLYYGKKVEGGGVRIREDAKLSEPVDITFHDEYYYNISSGDFYKKNKKIIADEILKEVYAKHIKSTKPIKGIFIRNKIRFYRIFLNLIFEYTSKILSYLVKIISGDVYKYSFRDHINKKLNPKIEKPKDPIVKSEDKISFLGYKATPQCVLFYSVFHFAVFSIFYYFKLEPFFLIKIFSNTFLTLIYVMMSLIIIDKILPLILKKLIDIFSELSFHFLYKPIKL